MRLSEFEAKGILQKYGIAIPRGNIASNPDEAGVIAEEIGKPVVVKSQVLVAGRGKAGGILFADDPAETKKAASNLIGSTIKEIVVKKLLIEEKIDITEQFYASVAIDRQAMTYIILVSTEGGVDIEETAQVSPDKIARYRVDPDTGFNQSGVMGMLAELGMNKDDVVRLAAILDTLYTVTMDNDAEMVEINPLARTASGEFVAADAKIIIDDNALFRHPEFEEEGSSEGEATPLELEAKKQGLAYVDLDGDIGIIGNGAGLVMATLDLVHHFGGRPANFLDAGGGGDLEVTKKALLLVMSKPEVKAILLNILGGITRCDIVAQAVVEALNESSVRKPIAVRMMGTNEEEGARILNEAGIDIYPNVEKAIEAVLKL